MPATFTMTSGAEVRCSGKLCCDCGERRKALDIEVEVCDEETNESIGIKRIKLICPNCHSDLLEVAV
jgi:hypothetical protein